MAAASFAHAPPLPCCVYIAAGDISIPPLGKLGSTALKDLPVLVTRAAQSLSSPTPSD